MAFSGILRPLTLYCIAESFGSAMVARSVSVRHYQLWWVHAIEMATHIADIIEEFVFFVQYFLWSEN